MPVIRKVCRDGSCVWEVEYSGMVRCFAEHDAWNAHRFFEYVTECCANSSQIGSSS